jgi:hypothetical protein
MAEVFRVGRGAENQTIPADLSPRAILSRGALKSTVARRLKTSSSMGLVVSSR